MPVRVREQHTEATSITQRGKGQKNSPEPRTVREGGSVRGYKTDSVRQLLSVFVEPLGMGGRGKGEMKVERKGRGSNQGLVVLQS